MNYWLAELELVSIKMKSLNNVCFYDPHKPSGYEKSIGTKRR